VCAPARACQEGGLTLAGQPSGRTDRWLDRQAPRREGGVPSTFGHRSATDLCSDLFQCVYVCVCVRVCLPASVSPSICPQAARLSARPSVRPPTHPTCLSTRLSVYPPSPAGPAYPPASLSVNLNTHLAVDFVPHEHMTSHLPICTFVHQSYCAACPHSLMHAVHARVAFPYNISSHRGMCLSACRPVHACGPT
jgi:hypothetical protein